MTSIDSVRIISSRSNVKILCFAKPTVRVLAMSNYEISISSDKYSHEQIRNILKNNDTPWQIHEKKPGNRSRGSVDPTILVAIVGATGTVVGALIAGLFQLVSGKKGEKILFRSSNGATIEFPANLSPKELDEKIGKLKQLEDDKYKILLP
jgi:hypothetical protein